MVLSSSPPTAVIRGVEEISLSLTSISNTWALVIHYALITDRVASAGPCHEYSRVAAEGSKRRSVIGPVPAP